MIFFQLSSKPLEVLNRTRLGGDTIELVSFDDFCFPGVSSPTRTPIRVLDTFLSFFLDHIKHDSTVVVISMFSQCLLGYGLTAQVLCLGG